MISRVKRALFINYSALLTIYAFNCYFLHNPRLYYGGKMTNNHYNDRDNNYHYNYDNNENNYDYDNYSYDDNNYEYNDNEINNDYGHQGNYHNPYNNINSEYYYNANNDRTANIPIESRVDIIAPIKFAFNRMFKNFGIWLIAPIAVYIIAIVLIFAVFFGAFFTAGLRDEFSVVAAVSTIAVTAIVALIAAVLFIPYYNHTIRELDKEHVSQKYSIRDIFKDVPWKNSILLWVILCAVFSIISVIVIGLMFAVTDGLSSFGFLPILLVGLLGLSMFLITPFLSVMQFYVYDKNCSPMEAISSAIRDVKNNYLRTMATLLILIVSMTIIGAIPVIGLVVSFITAPLQALTTAHLYRQVSGGYAPVE